MQGLVLGYPGNEGQNQHLTPGLCESACNGATGQPVG